jgi:hypothetical protein
MTDAELRYIASASRFMAGIPARSRRQVKKLLARSHPHEGLPNVDAFTAPGRYRSAIVSMLEVVEHGLERFMPRRQARERLTGVLKPRGAGNG